MLNSLEKPAKPCQFQEFEGDRRQLHTLVTKLSEYLDFFLGHCRTDGRGRSDGRTVGRKLVNLALVERY